MRLFSDLLGVCEKINHPGAAPFLPEKSKELIELYLSRGIRSNHIPE